MLRLIDRIRTVALKAAVVFTRLNRVLRVATPMRTLGANHRSRIETHLLSLSAQDRYLRFGYPAQDAQIVRYVDGLNFQRDEVLGIYDSSLTLVAFAHMAYGGEGADRLSVEFGVSVLSEARGQGYGARLFERAAMQASNLGLRIMFIHALSENAPMLKIARAAGAHVQRDGSESQAFLYLPKPTMYSRMREVLLERIGNMDFRLKVRTHRIRTMLGLPNEAS